MGYAKTTRPDPSLRTGGRESMSLDVLKELFQQHFHAAPTHIQPLQGELGGSGRKIIRLANDRVSAVGVLYNGREENVAFLEFSKHFRRHLLPVPEIYAQDLDHGAYLEEDLGDTSLFEFLSRNRSGDDIAPAVVDAYRKSVGVLPRFQVEAARDFDYSFCYPIASFDRQSITWDLNYCKYYFLRLAGIPFNERALETDFDRLTHFLQSVPYALKNIRWLLHNVQLPIALPTLLGAFQSMLASEKLQSIAFEADNLVVRIFSFSFHHELPKDEAGNGGGFVFDGRGLPNPGREERFKSLTGQDPPVIDYLNQQERVHQYLASVFTLIDATVDNFQHRGFKNLMVSFGCTGGQHRSVYLAEQLAKHLRGRSGVEVGIRHLELEKLGMLHAVVGNLAK